MARRLRSGYTTGACAAAAAKAAVLCLLTDSDVTKVEIPFPDDSRHTFAVKEAIEKKMADGALVAKASVIKDAGDDPDVTNGAEIHATARYLQKNEAPSEQCVTIAGSNIFICRGEGVGMITKPGLAAQVGEPAINPVPREMITAAVLEGLQNHRGKSVLVSIGVKNGEELAEKTLNKRLGIIGGLSILGTTGIVRPVSAEAWQATIQASLDVAKEAGLEEVVLSTGRTSEKGVQKMLFLPEEAYAMMGDYLEFSLLEVKQRGFKKIHLAGMWAKIVKAALEIPQTHVRHGALEISAAADLLAQAGADIKLTKQFKKANTAREMYEYLAAENRFDIIEDVCKRAKAYGEKVSGRPVTVYLVTSDAKVVAHV